jgi:hypothetical protein
VAEGACSTRSHSQNELCVYGSRGQTTPTPDHQPLHCITLLMPSTRLTPASVVSPPLPPPPPPPPHHHHHTHTHTHPLPPSPPSPSPPTPQYVSEAVISLSESPLKAADIPAVLDMAAALHTRYPDFAAALGPTLAKAAAGSGAAKAGPGVLIMPMQR